MEVNENISEQVEAKILLGQLRYRERLYSEVCGTSPIWHRVWPYAYAGAASTVLFNAKPEGLEHVVMFLVLLIVNLVFFIEASDRKVDRRINALVDLLGGIKIIKKRQQLDEV